MSRRPVACAFVAVLALPIAAAAQQAPATSSDRSPVAFGVVGGLSAGRGDSGASVGGTLTFILSDRTSIEGRGVYMDRGPGAEALDLNASLLVNLLTDRQVLPYLAVGAGIYRASFDLDDTRFLGMMGVPNGQPWRAGWMTGHGPWNGGTWNGPRYTPSEMPMFYANRIGPMLAPNGGRWGYQSFTDPAVTVGGGVRVDLTKSLYVRPDARALIVIADGDTFTVGSFSVGLGYRF